MAPEVVAEGVVLLQLKENLDREMAAAEAKVKAGMKAIDAEEAELRVKNDKAMKALDELRARQKAAIKDAERAQEAGDKKAERNAQARAKRASAALDKWAADNAALNTKLARIEKKRTDLHAQGTRERVAAEGKYAKAAEAAEKKAAAATAAAERKKRQEREKTAREDEKAAKKKQREEDAAAKARQKAADDEAKAEEKRRADIAKAAAQRERESARRRAQRRREEERDRAARRRAEEQERRERYRANERAAAERRRQRERDAAADRATIERNRRDREQAMRDERRMVSDRINAERMMDRDLRTRALAPSAQAAEAAELNRQLVQQARLLNALHRKRRPLTAEKGAAYDVDVTAATAKIALLQAKLRALNATPVDIKINVDRTLAQRIADTSRRIANFAGTFKDIAVRVGPFTTSMGTLIKVLMVLGPIITSLVGSMSALVGAMGAGLVGAMTIGGAAAAGFTLSMLGTVMAVKPVVAEVKNAMGAAKAYRKAVREYGKESDQAGKKLAIFNNVMKHQTAETKANFLAGTQMKKRWKEITEPSRAAAFKTIGDGIKFASDNMKWFGKETNTSVKAMSDGLGGWMDRLNSGTGRGVLQNIFGNWNEALPALMRGLGNVGAYLGKVFSAASDHLPGIIDTFEKWSDTMNKGFKEGSIDRLVGEAKTLGNFLLAGGRALRAFFSTGREGGGNFLKDMTEGLNRWTKHMEGPGAASYRKFFDDARKNTEALFATLGPIFTQFIDWAVRMTPAITGILTVFAGISSALMGFLNGVTKVGEVMFGLNDSGSTLLATFGALWAFGKVYAFAAALLKVGAAIKAVTTAFVILRAAAAAALAMGSLSAGLGVLSAGAAAAGGGMAALGTGIAAMMGPVGWGILAIAGLASAIHFLSNDTDHLMEASKKMTEQHKVAATEMKRLDTVYKDASGGLREAFVGVRDAEVQLRDAQKEVKAAQKEVNDLRAAGKTGTDAYKDAVDRLRDAENRRVDSQAALYEAEQRRKKLLYEMTDALNKRAEAAKKDAEAGEKGSKSMLDYEVGDRLQRAAGTSPTLKDAIRELAVMAEQQGRPVRELMNEYATGSGRAAEAMQEYLGHIDAATASNAILLDVENQRVLAALNAARGSKYLMEISANAAKSFAAIAASSKKLGGKINMKIATTYENPQDAARVAGRAAAALKRGVSPKVVFDIVANGGPAKKVMDTLDGRKPKDKTVKIKGDKGHADRTLDDVDGRNPKKKNVVIGGLPGIFMSVWGALDGLRKTLKVAISGDTSPLKSIWDSLSGWAKTLVVGIQGKPGGKAAKPRFMGGPVEPHASGAASADRVIADAARRASTVQPERTRGGRYKKPTLLIGEEDRTEYVIATNPAYRSRNEKYLAQAASDFGMTVTKGDQVIQAAKGGKAPRRAGKGTKKPPSGYKGPVNGWWDTTPNNDKGRDKQTGNWFIPKGYKVSNGQIVAPGWVPQPKGDGFIHVPPSQFKMRDPRSNLTKGAAAAGAVDPQIANDVINDYESLGRSIARQETRVKDMKADLKAGRGITGTASAKKKKRKARQEQIDKAERTLRRDRKKQRGLASKYQRSILNRSATSAMEFYEDTAAREADNMSTAEIEGNVDKFYTARKNRRGALESLHGLLVTAASKANAPWQAELARRRDAAWNDIIATDNTPFSGSASPLSMLTPEEAKQLENIRTDISLNDAGVASRYADSYADLTAGDDTPTAKEAQVKFWERELAEATAKGSPATVIQAIAGELGSAKSAIGESASGAAPEGPTQGQLLQTERYNLLRDHGSNTYGITTGNAAADAPGSGGMGINPSTLADPYQGGDVLGAMSGGNTAAERMAAPTVGGLSVGGSVGSAPSGGRSIVVNNTFATVPPDPHTWSQGVGFELGTIL